MGLMTAIDVALSAGVKFMMFFRQMWDLLPLVVRMLIVFSFGMVVLFGIIKMLF